MEIEKDVATALELKQFLNGIPDHRLQDLGIEFICEEGMKYYRVSHALAYDVDETEGCRETGLRLTCNEPDDLGAGRVSVFLSQHLKLWKGSGEPAPGNELQSIAAWLKFLGANGQEKTLETMRARMLLLTKAAEALHALGPEAEDKAGIYGERPDMRPRPEGTSA